MSPDPARILIADEDQPARRFLTDNLAADGYAVASAGSATAAAVLLAHDPFDMVLVDVNGHTLALLDRVRRGGLDRVALDLPVFVLTSNGDEHHRIRLFERGADEVQLKPYSYLELRQRVAALLRRCRRPAPVASASGASSSTPAITTRGSTASRCTCPRPSSRCSACWPRRPPGRSPEPS